MNQHNVRRVGGQRLEAGMNGGLARGAAIRRGAVVKPGDGLIEHLGVIRVQHRLDSEDVGVIAECLHGPRNHGPSADCPVLLGAAGAGAKSAPRCDNDGGRSWRGRHWNRQV